MMMFNTGFNMNQDEISVATGLVCPDESRTIQSAEEEANINTIVRKFGITGELPGDMSLPQSGDFTGIGSFHDAMNAVRAAQEQFMRVPSSVRERFNNDPAKLLAFVHDESNRDEATKLGLLRSVVPEPAPMRVQVVPPSGTPEGGAAAG